MKTIGILKDCTNSNIAVLTPDNINTLQEFALFTVENNMGMLAGYSNLTYTNAGAKILQTRQEVIEQSDIVLTYNTALAAEEIKPNKVYIGAFDILGNLEIINPYLQNGINVFSLSLLPRTTIAQSMDILSSTSSLLGYRAVLMAANKSAFILPMISGAGGTLRPANVLIIGAGVAGLQAIATAKRLGAIVSAFDVREAAKTEVESLGAKFVVIAGAEENKNSGGYAVEQTKDYLDKITSTLFNEAVKADIIICTAKVPGKKAPILITKKSVEKMKHGSVVVDLAAESGGNCEVTIAGKTSHTENGVNIIGDTNLLAGCNKSASFLIGNNFTKFLTYYFKNLSSQDDEILNATQIITDGKVTNQRITTNLNT